MSQPLQLPPPQPISLMLMISSGPSPRRYLVPQLQPVVVFLPFSAMQRVKGVSVTSARTGQWVAEEEESCCRQRSVRAQPSLGDEESGSGRQGREAHACLPSVGPQPVLLCWLRSRGPVSRHAGSADREAILWGPEKPAGHLGT